MPQTDAREDAVAAELAAAGGAVGFSALRRRTGLHPQALSRVLQRMQDAGRITKSDEGYRVNSPSRLPAIPAPNVVLLQVRLPPHLDPRTVAASLEKRWFHDLVWHGRRDEGEVAVLTWLRRSGTFVRLRAAPGALQIDVDAAPAEDATVFASVRGLLSAITELFAATSPAGSQIAQISQIID